MVRVSKCNTPAQNINNAASTSSYENDLSSQLNEVSIVDSIFTSYTAPNVASPTYRPLGAVSSSSNLTLIQPRTFNVKQIPGYREEYSNPACDANGLNKDCVDYENMDYSRYVESNMGAANPERSLHLSELRYIDLKNAPKPLNQYSFRGQNLHHINFAGVNLSGLDFTGADFRFAYTSNADFRGATLKNANFQAAILYKVNFTSCNLRESNFSHVFSAYGTTFVNANCSRASFLKANLTGAKIDGIQLKGAITAGLHSDRVHYPFSSFVKTINKALLVGD